MTTFTNAAVIKIGNYDIAVQMFSADAQHDPRCNGIILSRPLPLDQWLITPLELEQMATAILASHAGRADSRPDCEWAISKCDDSTFDQHGRYARGAKSDADLSRKQRRARRDFRAGELS